MMIMPLLPLVFSESYLSVLNYLPFVLLTLPR